MSASAPLSPSSITAENESWAAAVERSDLESFSEVIAHELRTPLAVLTTASETLLARMDHIDQDKLNELLRMINRNSRLASLLLNRLGLARDIEQDTVALSLARVELVELVRDSISDLSDVVLGGRAVAVTAPEQLQVIADATAVREIVFNLLSNAAKYSPGGAKIEVHIAQVGDRAQVRVHDHGAGMTPAERDRVFEKYVQLDRGSPGAGLGLYISRGLANAHGGDIEIDIAIDEGTEFVLDLPVDGGDGAHGTTSAGGGDAGA